MSTPQTTAMPAGFEDFDVIEGFTPIDKEELVNVPFGITGVRYRENERKVRFAELEIVNLAGERMAFQDSSTGVATQIADYLASKDMGAPVGEWMDVRLFVPQGLRVSKYDVIDPNGRPKVAKTYYLTLKPRDRAPTPAAAPAPAPARTKAPAKPS